MPHSSYSEIRGILASEYRDLPNESIEALVEGSFGSTSAEDLESFLSGLKKVGSVVTKALPTVLPVVGTVAGTAFGGPAGAMLGGTLGKLAGGAVQGATSKRPLKIPKPAALIRKAAGTAVQALGAPGGSPAAAQLVGLLNRPEILQSLMAMMLGAAGRPNIPVAGNPVPVGAVANLIGTLANQAAAEYNATAAHEGESIPGYLLNESGEFVVDPAVPEERARVLLGLLNEAAAMETDESDESDESDEDWDDVIYEDYDSDPEDQELEDAYYDMLELSDSDPEDE